MKYLFTDDFIASNGKISGLIKVETIGGTTTLATSDSQKNAKLLVDMLNFALANGYSLASEGNDQ